eukprot:3502919-Rhodomonas_salina.2
MHPARMKKTTQELTGIHGVSRIRWLEHIAAVYATGLCGTQRKQSLAACAQVPFVRGINPDVDVARHRFQGRAPAPHCTPDHSQRPSAKNRQLLWMHAELEPAHWQFTRTWVVVLTSSLKNHWQDNEESSSHPSRKISNASHSTQSPGSAPSCSSREKAARSEPGLERARVASRAVLSPTEGTWVPWDDLL